MPFINLIAEQRAQKRARAKKTRVWLLTSLAISVLGSGTFGFLLMRTDALQADIHSLEVQSEELKPIKDAIAMNQQFLAALRPRMETLSSARLDTERWSRILDHMSLVMPENTWLTMVNSQQASDEAKPVEISWTGMSTEQNLVGDLMLRMQRSPDLQNLQLKYTETKHSSYGVGLEFQIACEVAGTDNSTGAVKKEALKS